jgi:putative protease
VRCLKVEGRKKKPEYVATVTNTYRGFLDRVAKGQPVAARPDEVQPLVQIYSRGFTGGMLGGRVGRDYVTRTQPDNRGAVLGTVVAVNKGEIVVEVNTPVAEGDGLGFEAPDATGGASVGCTITRVRMLSTHGVIRQALTARVRVQPGWRVLRTADGALLTRARASYANLPGHLRTHKVRLDVRLFGQAGAPLKAEFHAAGEVVSVQTDATLSPASQRPLDHARLREQLGRLGDTPFALTSLDAEGLAPGLFLPVSQVNHLRQQATAELLRRRDWAHEAGQAARRAAVEAAVQQLPVQPRPAKTRRLVAEVFDIADARAAADAGATEVVLDPFLRHPTPPVSRVRALGEELASHGVSLRLRTPTIVRPEDRRALDKWLALELPMQSGHLGLVTELARAGRDVTADYAVNVMNAHAAAEIFRLGARRVTASVELTVDEIRALVAPWNGAGFEVLLYGRPEGMTIEHCVLSAAFDRVPTTCRDLCVQKHPNVQLTDPAGYAFPVATDSACRNRLLHSRPVEGSEFLPSLWDAGVRSFRAVFNVAGDPVAGIIAGYRQALDALAEGDRDGVRHSPVRALVGSAFTRGHFVRAV